jgi:redox-sensing transcriptional repressor
MCAIKMWGSPIRFEWDRTRSYPQYTRRSLRSSIDAVYEGFRGVSICAKTIVVQHVDSGIRATLSLLTEGETQGISISYSSIYMKTEKISELTTNRLSVYLRCLNDLAAAGVEAVSSQSLAEQFNLNSAQIRKDLAYFGEFGVRGVGYYVEDLRQQLRRILGLSERRRVAIIGLGHLGTALANYQGFNLESFEIIALFDDDPSKVGVQTRMGLTVQSTDQLGEILRREKIEIVILTVPGTAAERVLEQVTEAGVKAILNFAPVHLNAKPGVKVKTVDLTISLESLSYFLANPGSNSGEGINVDYREFLRQEAGSNGSAD